MILRYLTQPSTWRGLISLAMSFGLLHISPEAQDQVVTVALQVIAAGQAVIGVINVLRNECKQPTPPKGPQA